MANFIRVKRNIGEVKINLDHVLKVEYSTGGEHSAYPSAYPAVIVTYSINDHTDVFLEDQSPFGVPSAWNLYMRFPC